MSIEPASYYSAHSSTTALDSNGQVYSWGYNNYGQLGDGTTTNRTSPVLISATGVLAGKTIKAIAKGHYSTNALDSNGKVYSWGLNDSGQLGNNSNTNSLVPVAVNSTGVLTNKVIQAIASGSYHVLALDTDGVTYAWGNNSSGQLGDNTTTNRAVPVITNANNFLDNNAIQSIAAGGYYNSGHSLALDNYGQIYAWGLNSNGQLGNNSKINISVPVVTNTSSILGTPPTLTLGNLPATNVNVINSTTLTATTPAHAAGLVDATVTNYDTQSATLANSYNYSAPPTITSISPNAGLTSGNNNVFIYGTNFSNATTISFGGVLASVSFIDETTILATVPASSLPGIVDVVATDEFSQTGALVGGYTYRLANPSLISASPNKSVMKGGGTITVTGTGFVTKAGGGSWYKLLIAVVEATNINVVNATTLTATVPAHSPGVVDIELISDFTDSSKLTNSFTYLPDSYTFASLPCTNNTLNSDGINCSLMATEPGHFKIEAKDKDGNLVISTNNISLNLSTTSGSGSFARSGGLNPDGSPQLTWGIANVVIPAGENSVDVWYRDSLAGSPTITVKDSLNTSISKNLTIISRYKLLVTGVTDPTNVGVPSSITVQAVDYTGVPQSDYRGTIAFTSTDGLAKLPANYTFVSTDRGRKTFTNSVTFKTQGIWDVIATDTNISGVVGQQTGIVVDSPPDGTISKLKFITPVQSFPLDKTSGIITVQTRDNIGQAIPADADTDIYLTTSSSTGQFSLDDGTTWLTPDANGQIKVTLKAGESSLNFRYQDTTKNTHILKVSNSPDGNFGWTLDTQNIVVGVGAPAKMDISGPTSVGTGEWFPITVSLTDASDNAVSATNDVTFNIKVAGSAKLSLNIGGNNPVSELDGQLFAGQSSATVYAWSNEVGSSTFTVTDSRPILDGEVNLTSDQLTVSAFAKPSRLVMSTTQTDIMVHSKTAVNVSLQDQFGNIATAENDFNFNLDSSSDQTEFATTINGTWASMLNLTILAGTGETAAYLTQPTVENNVIISTLSQTYGKVDHLVNFVPNVYTKLRFLNPATSLTAGDSTSYTVQLLDNWNNPTTHGSDITIGLGSNNQTILAGQPRSTWDGQAASNPKVPYQVDKTITISAGQTGATSTYRDTLASDKTVLSTWDNAKWVRTCHAWNYDRTVCINWSEYSNQSLIYQAINVSPDTPKLYSFTTDPQTIIKNTVSQPITINITDQFTNPTHLNSATGFNLNSTSLTGKFSSDQLGDQSISQLQFAANSSTATFYYQDSTISPIAGFNLSLSSNLTGASQPIRVIEGFATNLNIDTAGATTMKAGDYLPITIKAMTSDGREVVVLGDKIINLAADEGTFYTKVGQTYSAVSQITIPAESSRTNLNELYFRSTLVGDKVLAASGSGLALAKANVAVIPDNFTKLAFTASPKTIEITKTSSAFNVTTQDLYGNVTIANPTAATIINLNSSQASGQFSDDTTTWGVSSTLIPIGQSVASFYYRNGTMNGTNDALVDASVLGNQNITASSCAATDSVTTKIVGQMATKLNLSPTSMSLIAGKVSSEVELQLQNSDGSAAISTTDQLINLSSLNQSDNNAFEAIYGADKFSSNGVDIITSVTVPAGASRISFYLISRTAINHRIKASANIYNFSNQFVRTITATQLVNVTPDVPSQTVIRSAHQVIHPIMNNTVDEYSAPIRIVLADQFGNPTSQASDRTIELTTSCSQGIFMDSPTGSVITSIKLLAGQSEIAVYYRDAQAHADDCNLTVTSTPLNAGSQGIGVREKVLGLVITTDPQQLVAGDTSDPISVSTKDRYGNIVTAETNTPLIFTADNTKADVGSSGTSTAASTTALMTSLGIVSTMGTTSTTSSTILAGDSTTSFTYVYPESVNAVVTDNLTVVDSANILGEASQEITILAGAPAKLKWQTTTLNGQVDNYLPTQIGLLNDFDLATAATADITVNLTNAAGTNSVTGQPAADFYTKNPDNSYSQITSVTITTGNSLSPTVYYRQTTTTYTHAYDGYSPYGPILNYSTDSYPTSVTATSGSLIAANLNTVNITALKLSFSTGNFSALGRAFTPIKVNVDKALPTDTTINLNVLTSFGGAFYDSNNIPDDADLINHKITTVVIPADGTSSNQVYFRQDAQTSTYPHRQPAVLSAEPVSPVYSTWGVRNSATIYYGTVTQINYLSGPNNLEQNQTGSYVFQTKDSMGNITPFIPYVYGQANQETFCLYTKTTSLNAAMTSGRASDEICPAEPGVVGFVLYAGEANLSFNYQDQIVGSPTLTVSSYSSGSGGIMTNKQLNITPAITKKVVIEPTTYGLVKGDTINNMKIKLMSTYNLNVNSLGDTTIDLTTNSPTGQFKNPANGQWQSSLSVVILSGDKDVTVSYRNDEAALGSTDNIIASSGTLTPGNATVNIVTGSVASAAFATSAQTLERLQTGQVKLKLQDAFGNQTVTTTDTCVYLTTVSLTAKLTQTNPVGALTCASLALPDGSLVHGLTVKAGTSEVSFNYQDSTNGVYELKTSLAANLKASPATQSMTIIDGGAANLRFDPVGSSIERGGVASMAVSLTNAYGAEVKTDQDKFVELTSNSISGEFALTDLNSWQTSLIIKIPAGSSRTELLYRDTIAEIGDYQLSAIHTDNLGTPYTVEALNPANADLHIVNGLIKGLVYTTPSYETIASHPSKTISIELRNQFGYAVTATTDQTIYLSSSSTSGEFALSEDGPWGIANAKILAGQSNLDIYYRDSTEGKHQITARTSADNVEVADTQDQTITRQVMDHFLVTNISTPQKAGTPSSVVVFAVDSAGYVVQWYAGTINFSADTTDAIYPSDSYTFDPKIDRGIHTFTNGIAFKLAGFKNITATDLNGLSGTQYDIEVLGGNTNPVKSVAIISPETDPTLLDPNEVSPRITLQLRDASGNPTNATAIEGYPLRLTSSSPTTQFAFSPTGPWTNQLDVTIEQGLGYSRQPIYCRDNTNGTYVVTASDWVAGADDIAVDNDTMNVVTKDLKLTSKLTIKSKDYTGTLIDNPYLFSNSSTGTISGQVELETAAKNRQSNNPTAANWQIKLKTRQDLLIDSADFTDRTDIKYISKELTPSHLETSYLLDIRSDANGLSGIDMQTIPISPWLVNLSSLNYDYDNQTLDLTLIATNSDQPADLTSANFYLLSQNLSFSLSSLLASGQAKLTTTGNYQISLPAADLASGNYQIAISALDKDGILAQDLKSFTVTAPIVEVPITPVVPAITSAAEVPDNTSATETKTPINTPNNQADEVTDTEADNNVVAPTVLGELWHSAITSPITPIVASGSFFLVLALIAIVLAYQAYREWSRSKWLLAMIKKDKALVEDKDAFLQLAAHYLRTPIAIVGSSVDLMKYVFSSNPDLTNRLIAIASNLREKSEQILARTNESPNIDKITAEDEKAFKLRILRSPIFWLPITLSVVLTLAVNLVITSLGGQNLNTGFIVGQMLSIILAAIILYTAVREFTMYREKEIKLEDYRIKSRALDNIKNQFIADVYDDLSYDVAELATHDIQSIDNETIRNSLVDATTRLNKLIERFATLINVQKGNLELSQFSLDSLINDAINELALNMPNQPADMIPTSLHQDKRLLLKVIETILTTMSGKGSVKDFKFKASTTHNGSIKLEISGKTKFALLSTSGNLFSGELAATDIEHYNYNEPADNPGHVNADYTVDADNANAKNPGENNDDANTANNLDIYLSKLIVNRLGGKLSIKQYGERAVVGLVVPVNE